MWRSRSARHPPPRGRWGPGGACRARRAGPPTPGSRARPGPGGGPPPSAPRRERAPGRGSWAATGRRRLPDLVRYLRAMAYRLEKLPANAARDELWMRQIAAVTAEYEQLRAQMPGTGSPDDPVARVRWMIEELRVGLFAQGVGTPRPVSEQRGYKAIDQLIA